MADEARTRSAGSGNDVVNPPQDYIAHHDPDGGARLTTTLVHALADVMDVDVTDTGFVLADYIDPEALDTLFVRATDVHGRSFGHVAFLVDRHRVTIYSDGTIVITPPTE